MVIDVSRKRTGNTTDIGVFLVLIYPLLFGVGFMEYYDLVEKLHDIWWGFILHEIYRVLAVEI